MTVTHAAQLQSCFAQLNTCKFWFGLAGRAQNHVEQMHSSAEQVCACAARLQLAARKSKLVLRKSKLVLRDFELANSGLDSLQVS